MDEMDELYGAWMPKSPYARDFVLFLTSVRKYFIISRDSTLGNSELAIEWGNYEPEFIHTVSDERIDPYNVRPCIARMRFSREGSDGTDRDISYLLQTDWLFVPSKLGEAQPSEITIHNGSILGLIRCQSIEFS